MLSRAVGQNLFGVYSPWVDWFSPSRIWVENWNEGAVYSPDGMIIQFDRGTIWQRDLGQPVVLRRL
jgi:hypothetical protein